MNFIIFLAIFILFPSPSIAQQESNKIYKAKGEIPLEFIFLIDSFQIYALSPEEKNELAKNITSIDTSLQNIKKEEYYSLIKTEIYKAILEHKKPKDSTSYSNKLLNDQLNKKLSLDYRSYDPFELWLILAIRADIYTYSNFLEYESYSGKDPRRKSTSAAVETLRARSNLNLLIPWYEMIIGASPQELHASIKPFLSNLIKRLAVCLQFYIQTMKAEPSSPPTNSTLVNFAIEDATTQKPESLQSLLDKIISDPAIQKKDSVTENLNVRPVGPQSTPASEWVPKETGASVQPPPGIETPVPTGTAAPVPAKDNYKDEEIILEN